MLRRGRRDKRDGGRDGGAMRKLVRKDQLQLYSKMNVIDIGYVLMLIILRIIPYLFVLLLSIYTF